MKGDKQVIKYLNECLKNELTAINQYFLHSRMLEDWGITKLAKHEYNESIEEMNHADDLIKRILLIGGLPNLQDLGKLHIGESVREVLECDLKLEEKAIPDLRNGIEHCEKVHDYVSRDLLVKILRDEEDHGDHIQTQLDLLDKIGEERYIQLNSDPAGEGEAA
ncbi:MAG: bacterioferritin [Alphaproteobacteria bacterium]